MPVDADEGCVGPPRCESGALHVCEPDGTETVIPCDLGCSPSDATRCARLLPSNVDVALLEDGLAPLVLDSDVDTATCGLSDARVQSQVGGPELCVLRGSDITVPAGATVRVVGPRPLVLLATGTVRIEGTLDVSARGETPGPGGGSGGTALSPGGDGPSPGRDGSMVDRSEGGGGGGGLCGAGGSGGSGHSAAGGGGGAALGASFDLSPLTGGSGGGRGGADPAVIGRGGAGGGGLQISARGAVEIVGTILAGGGGGDGAGSLACGVNAGAGGGGGSGGPVLIEAPTVTYGPSATIITGGGGGGGSSNGCRESDDGGTDGQDGRLTADRASGGVGNGSYSTWGGEGGGGADPAGSTGGSVSIDGGNGGGGGGAAGCILVRNRDASLPAGGTISSTAPSAHRADLIALE